jgi:hypothetical protein
MKGIPGVGQTQDANGDISFAPQDADSSFRIHVRAARGGRSRPTGSLMSSDKGVGGCEICEHTHLCGYYQSERQRRAHWCVLE